MSFKAKLEVARQSETPENRAVVPLIPPTAGVDLTNVQGDIYPTFPKKYEGFIFFTIKDADAFRTCLRTFKSSITTSDKVIKILKKIQSVRLANIENETAELADIPNQFNIGFSHAALNVLGIDPKAIGDDDFGKGPMKLGAEQLGDIPAPDSTARKYIPDWDKHWMDPENPIHGVVVVASQNEDNYGAAIAQVEQSFGTSIKINFTLDGKVRDGELKGHEFFGFLDGISQPAIRGLVKPHAGQLACDPGVIIHGTSGDIVRPAWALGGSIMAFRQLQQFVYEFDDFLEKHAIPFPGDPNPKLDGAHRRGARMFGRWKSGCPVDIKFNRDDPAIGGNPEENNNFNYSNGRDVWRCPITAHVRKMAPRAIEGNEELEGKLIMRGSIPYGREKTDEEERAQATQEDRGLLFASYQSILGAGFKFIQESWANNIHFPPMPTDLQPIGVPGFDPIIGANVGADRKRFTRGQDPGNLTSELKMKQDFIKARGGEYFWVPGMIAINMIAANLPMNS